MKETTSVKLHIKQQTDKVRNCVEREKRERNKFPRPTCNEPSCARPPSSNNSEIIKSERLLKVCLTLQKAEKHDVLIAACEEKSVVFIYCTA